MVYKNLRTWKKRRVLTRQFAIFFSVVLIIASALVVYNFYLYKKVQIQPLPQTTETSTKIPSKITEETNLTTIEDLSTKGFIEIKNISVQEGPEFDNVVLADGCRGLIGAVDKVQGESIIAGLNKVISVRPRTHDLMKDAFDILGVKVLMSKVVGIKGNNFIGRLILQQGDKIVSLDSRPSDGVAIAIRMNASVYVNGTLFEEKGENIC